MEYGEGEALGIRHAKQGRIPKIHVASRCTTLRDAHFGGDGRSPSGENVGILGWCEVGMKCVVLDIFQTFLARLESLQNGQFPYDLK